MKLSSNTTMVLKNFATINQNLVIKEGNELLTMSSMKNIVAKATVDESFPRELAIYDLNEFLAVVTSFQNPVLDFHEQHLIIKEENEPHKKYIDATYDEHYSQNKYQSTEFIIDSGHGEGFFIGNILKYAQRYGKKNGKNRDDLLKVIHYGIIALYVNDHEVNLNELNIKMEK